MSGANAGIPSSTGMKISPPRIHHTNPYAAPHPNAEPYPCTRSPSSQPNGADDGAIEQVIQPAGARRGRPDDLPDHRDHRLS
jgi:hypothetical protein